MDGGGFRDGASDAFRFVSCPGDLCRRGEGKARERTYTPTHLSTYPTLAYLPRIHLAARQSHARILPSLPRSLAPSLLSPNLSYKTPSEKRPVVCHDPPKKGKKKKTATDLLHVEQPRRTERAKMENIYSKGSIHPIQMLQDGPLLRPGRQACIPTLEQ